MFHLNISILYDKLQLLILLISTDESFCKLTLDRQSKISHVADALKDICDGSEYQRLMRLPNIDSKERSLTFTMNTGIINILMYI